MRYTIFQVDNTRDYYVKDMLSELNLWNWERVQTECVDGRIPEQLEAAQKKHPYTVYPNHTMGWPRFGHLGIWYTVLNALEHAPIVTFEDDAILMEGWFGVEFNKRIAELPDDADFFALFIPRDSDQKYQPRHDYGGTKTCKVYQPYGGVSMYYTEQGAKKIKKLLERDGLVHQYDNVLMNYAWHGELNGYTSKPAYPDLVRITGNELSIVQETEYAG